MAPALLLSQKQLGAVSWVPGLVLLAVGAASLLGAVCSRVVDSDACSRLQWRSILASAWLLNPVVVIIIGVAAGFPEICCWSGLPLGAALVVLLGRLQLVEGGPGLALGGDVTLTRLLYWLCSRVVFVGVPAFFLSFQVALYLPRRAMMPQGPMNVLFMCGGCIFISGKFCAMCSSLAQQKLSQAVVLVVLLSADWVSSLHLMDLVVDTMKTRLLLVHLLLAGLVQLCAALARLRLRPRWKRALAQRHAAREVAVGAGIIGDAELGAQINAGGSLESSDSDDERGPGSLPGSFYEVLAALVGVPQSGLQRARREWLCGPRRAVVQNLASSDSQSEEAGASPAAAAGRASAPEAAVCVAAAATGEARGTAGGPALLLEIAADERICVVCQEEILSGEPVRPLPKCGHKFHAHCLEHWARTMRESTRCPTCRRPALARKPGIGGTSISALAVSPQARETSARGQITSSGSGARRPPPSRRLARRARAEALPCASSQSIDDLVELREHHVIVDKDGGELGLDVMQQDGALIVSRIKTGPLTVWNQHHQDASVSRGDRIVEVNGHRGSAQELITAIKAASSLRLVLGRVEEFRVTIQRAQGVRHLGLEITQHPQCLQVLSLSEGPVQRWCQSVEPELQVLPGDLIVEVNGERGTCAQILGVLQSEASTLALVLRRGVLPHRTRHSTTSSTSSAATSLLESVSLQAVEARG